MAGFADGKIHKDNCPSNVFGGVTGSKIYKGNTPSNIIGGASGGKVYRGNTPSNIICSVKDCTIKGMERENEALMVAAYHFLVKSIF